MTVCARGSSLSIGREDGDLKFRWTCSFRASTARSKKRTAIRAHGLESRTGTYVRIRPRPRSDAWGLWSSLSQVANAWS